MDDDVRLPGRASEVIVTRGTVPHAITVCLDTTGRKAGDHVEAMVLSRPCTVFQVTSLELVRVVPGGATPGMTLRIYRGSEQIAGGGGECTGLQLDALTRPVPLQQATLTEAVGLRFVLRVRDSLEDIRVAFRLDGLEQEV